MPTLWKIHILQWWARRAVDAHYGVPMYHGLRSWQSWWIRRGKEAA